MGQVSVTLNGRTYRLECGEGEEAHLIALSEYLGSHVETMKHKFGQVGDDRLILMASLDGDRRTLGGAASASGDQGNMAELRRDRSSADELSKSAAAPILPTRSAPPPTASSIEPALRPARPTTRR